MISIPLSSSNPSQLFNFRLPSGDVVSCKLTYRVRIQQWYLTLSYKTYTINNIRVCANPNILEQYTRLFPFGIFVQVADDFEPFMVTDFYTQRCKLFQLETSELSYIATQYGEVS